MTPAPHVLARFLQRKLDSRHQTVEDFAEKAGLNASGLYQLLRGERKRVYDDTLGKIAAGLGMTTADLMAALERPRIPLSARASSLDVSYERWMAVMGPRMGEQEADDAFWDWLVQRAGERVELAEAAANLVLLTDNNAVEIGPDSRLSADLEEGGGPLNRADRRDLVGAGR